MRSSLYALAGGAATALASVRGFNYASQSQTYDTFVSQFQTAAKLVGADDFTSARLYTMIQDSTTNTVISAIPAAIATNTTLLLGLWASENQAAFDNELTALKNAISQYGSSFADLVVGISVGSEDLYRNSPTGIAADSGYGQEPDVLVDYIKQVRAAIASTTLSSKPVGHVDTWNDFVNGSNSAVIEASDFLGLDEYPYYQTTDVNDVNNGSYLFFEAYDKVEAVAGGKPIWITETGWPVSGSTENLAVPSTANAEIYWQGVACELETRGIDFWWYILADSGATPSFGVTSTLGEETPLYNLACNSSSSSSSSSSTSDSKTSVSSVAQATTPSSAAASTTVAKGTPVPSGIASGTGSVSGSRPNSTDFEPTVYVTDVVKTTVTTCPVGHTLTTGGSTTVLASASVITTTYSTQTTISTSIPVSNVVYVTDVIKTTVTTCPVGHTLTTGGSTTVLASPSVITTTYSAQSTVSTKVPVSSAVGAVSGVAPVGTSVASAGVAGAAAPSGVAGAAAPSGVAGAAGASGVAGASGAAGASGSLAGGATASTLASSWAAGQTPTATGSGAAGSTYTGAATKMDGSMAALAVGAVVAVFAL